MNDYIPYSCQTIEEDDIEAVVRVLRSDWLTQGPNIDRFEQSVGSYCGAPFSIAVSSATAGLHLVCMALGLGPGDLVWTSPVSFTASANCARYVGADVDFVDVDPETGNMCPKALAEQLATAAKLPKLVIPVHFAGRPCDMAAIARLQQQYGFAVMEDAAHALGARYSDGKPVGSSKASIATVFSFHPVKPVTTGEGGVIVTHDAGLAERVRMLRTHGITREPARLQQKQMPAWYYEQQELGYNYRITDIQAALGTSQMTKLDRFTDARRAMARRYRELLRGLPLDLPPADDASSWHLYPARIRNGKRDAVFAHMRAANIGVNVHYMPIHWQPYYLALGFSKQQCPRAGEFFLGELSLPLHPRLTAKDQERVVDTLKMALGDTQGVLHAHGG